MPQNAITKASTVMLYVGYKNTIIRSPTTMVWMIG
jgi:hypothetical protein